MEMESEGSVVRRVSGLGASEYGSRSVGVRRVTRAEGGEFGIMGEIYEEGEDIMDVVSTQYLWL